MSLSLLKKTRVATGVKLLLASAGPLQSLLDRPGVTHEFCNRQALVILKNDGFPAYAEQLRQYLPELNLGVYWADEGWKNVHHYFEPTSHKGFWHFANAVHNFLVYYRLATTALRDGEFKKSTFFLGAAAHLVQDLCVPHHARVKLFSGHKHYEGWVEKRYELYAVASQGVYQEGRQVSGLIINNSIVAADLFDWVNMEDAETLYHEATEILLPLAQRTTTGLFRHFAAGAAKTMPSFFVNSAQKELTVA